jgi:hypothetical protein
VFKGKVPHCVIPNKGNTLPLVVLEVRRCLQDIFEIFADYEDKNYKPAEDETWFTYETFKYYKEQIQLPVYAIPFIFGITSNTIILIIIIFNKDTRTLPNMYIFNLAIGDVIILSFLFFITLADYASITLLYRDIFFVFFTYFYSFSVDLKAYSVTLLNILRYRITANPSRVSFFSQMTWCVAGAKLWKVWFVAALFALTTNLGLVFNMEYDTLFDKYGGLFEQLLSCVLPVSVMVIYYTMTECLHMERSCFVSEGTQNPQMNIRTTTAKVVWGINVVFLISYVPHYVLSTYSIFNIRGKYSVMPCNTSFMLEFSNFLLLANSCLNPVSVLCSDRAFRKHLKRYLTCCCKTNTPPTDLKLTRKI